MDLAINLIIWLIIIGGALGLYVKHNQSHKKQSSTAKLPLMGPMLAYEYWWPTTPKAKNILIGKLIVAIYIYLALTLSWIFFFTISMPLLFHFEWFKEK